MTSDSARSNRSPRSGLIATLVLHALGITALLWWYWDGPKDERMIPILFLGGLQLIWMIPAILICRWQRWRGAMRGLIYGAILTLLISGAYFALNVYVF